MAETDSKTDIMSGDVNQVSTEFKVRYRILGAHAHCRLFSRPKGQSTWQMCGEFVIGVEAQLSFWLAAQKFEYEEVREAQQQQE